MRIPHASPIRRAVFGLAVLLLLEAGVWTGRGQSSTPDAGNGQGAGSSKSGASKPHPTTKESSAAGKSSKTTKKATRQQQKANTARAARAARIRQAFIASKELRPMAEQLSTLRTPEAYAGVAAYARRHTGDAAGAAYLALGNAYLLDKHYPEAVDNLEKARKDSDELADFADYLAAQADQESGNDKGAEEILNGFTARYPDSIFAARVPELEATALVAIGNLSRARAVLDAAAASKAADRPGYLLAQGQVDAAMGEKPAAIAVFKRLLFGHPLAAEAQTARQRLIELGGDSVLTLAELRGLGDAYYNAGRYSDAAELYHAMLARGTGLSTGERNTVAVAEAACDLKLKRLTEARAKELADTSDENGARRLYLLMELARARDDSSEQRHIVEQMEFRFPRSPWLAEALFSSGNMYLLKRDYPNAITYYGYLADHFAGHKYAAAAHWRAGWLAYREGLYADAAQRFDAQIRSYPQATETASALYWRARIYETQEHSPAQAVADYRAILRAYPHYFYAQMAQTRLAGMGRAATVSSATEEARLKALQPSPDLKLADAIPTDSPQLAKARLLANAGLSEYVSEQIQADPAAAGWSALVEAQIYASYDDAFRALRAMKRAVPSASSASINAIPMAYWRILFPEPWWEAIKAEAFKNNLDPYLIVSLIRQESEFNPSAVSHAGACGLMQLLPSVGKSMAHDAGIKNFQTFQLFNAETNIKLGVRYLRQVVDHFGGVDEYALAAYNAGESRVSEWQSAGPYSGIDEFVESIPFTETREYVEAILRNEETYRALDTYAKQKTATAAAH